jgi:hypothetical protein
VATHERGTEIPKADSPLSQQLAWGGGKREWSVAAENVDPDAMFDRKKANGDDRGPTATEWLVSYLTEHGESPREVVVFEGTKAGFKEETLKKAMLRDDGNRTAGAALSG